MKTHDCGENVVYKSWPCVGVCADGHSVHSIAARKNKDVRRTYEWQNVAELRRLGNITSHGFTWYFN